MQKKTRGENQHRHSLITLFWIFFYRQVFWGIAFAVSISKIFEKVLVKNQLFRWSTLQEFSGVSTQVLRVTFWKHLLQQSTCNGWFLILTFWRGIRVFLLKEFCKEESSHEKVWHVISLYQLVFKFTMKAILFN